MPAFVGQIGLTNIITNPICVLWKKNCLSGPIFSIHYFFYASHLSLMTFNRLVQKKQCLPIGRRCLKKENSTIFYLPVESDGLPLSIKSINWLSLGVMMISVRRFFNFPSGVSLLATGLYSPRPPAVRRFGSTPKLF